MKIQILLLVSTLSLISIQASASPTFSTPAAVGNAYDLKASFDSLTQWNSADLANYTENGLYINTPGSWANFNMCTNPCWYPNTGYYQQDSIAGNLAHIGLVNHQPLYGIEFTIFSGLPRTEEKIYWETYLNGVLSGQGSEQWQGDGSTVSWTDTQGISELRVGLYDPLGQPGLGGAYNNLMALDNLQVKISQVPIPSVLALWLLGLTPFMGFRRRRNRN